MNIVIHEKPIKPCYYQTCTYKYAPAEIAMILEDFSDAGDTEVVVLTNEDNEIIDIFLEDKRLAHATVRAIADAYDVELADPLYEGPYSVEVARSYTLNYGSIIINPLYEAEVENASV